MDKRPLFLGKGRGRGRGNEEKGTNPAAGQSGGRGHLLPAKWGNSRKAENGGANSPKVPEASKERQEKANKIKESAKRYLERVDDEFEDSSEDEEINDSEILNNTLKNYRNTSQDSEEGLNKTAQYLIDSCKPGSSVCLICIASIKHVDAVWNCSQCFSTLHLQCIQKWARDGAAYNLLSSDNISQADLPWYCPKCRFEFKQSDCPTRYYCFCEKQENPLFDPWLTPHSCGQSCSKPLKPECGHDCLLLCHPGPCPPCPKTVRVSCHCGSHPPVVRRCSAKSWSCGKPCGKLLSCDHHNCESPCHPGGCLPCPKESIQSCLCGKVTSKRPCASPEWQCEQVCDKVLSCGHHRCERLCHADNCGDCPRTGERKCPCGQTTLSLPCTEDVPTCGGTCDKPLACGRHKCTQQCHTGSCGVCRQVVTKTCRCGKREKNVLCSQGFLCEVKCLKMRQCERHPCKRKCCDGHCPSCELTCNRTLNCRNHKCPSQCHRGPCYPCPLQVDVKCFCGATVLTLPCGREKVTKPPKCAELCRYMYSISSLPCSSAKPFSCARACGRQLSCGNHTCQLECHVVTGASDNQQAGKECQVCEEPCSKPRPEGCKHDCPLPCHPGDCPSCKQMVKLPCHCRLMLVYVSCSELTSADEQTSNELMSCKNQCPKILAACGHRCSSNCHAGPCPSPELCNRKTAVRCPCRRKKRDFPCHMVQRGEAKLECDKDCNAHKMKQKKETTKEEELRKQEELRAQQEELEWFERKQRGKKRRPRKQKEEIIEPSWFQRYSLTILMLSVAVGLIAGLFFIAMN
ncbi:NF-X1-type zinc finger protein NFXL1-like [Orbicella faveolata]|uniref:NF-X1-type zinc finger protein NFXL1-like n=1 Tax=Orbicella faveolata TaxID=48498 RepID=UPI0009E56853|nr:NF-X1-type zinc finger protein NFXL1-like [Orbicella faveolata]